MVDEIGGIEDAINYAAEKAGIEKNEIKTKSLPEYKSDELLEIIEMFNEQESSVQSTVSPIYTNIINQIDFLNNYKASDKIQARFPYSFVIE